MHQTLREQSILVLMSLPEHFLEFNVSSIILHNCLLIIKGIKVDLQKRSKKSGLFHQMIHIYLGKPAGKQTSTLPKIQHWLQRSFRDRSGSQKWVDRGVSLEKLKRHCRSLSLSVEVVRWLKAAQQTGQIEAREQGWEGFWEQGKERDLVDEYWRKNEWVGVLELPS